MLSWRSKWHYSYLWFIRRRLSWDEYARNSFCESGSDPKWVSENYIKGEIVRRWVAWVSRRFCHTFIRTIFCSNLSTFQNLILMYTKKIKDWYIRSKTQLTFNLIKNVSENVPIIWMYKFSNCTNFEFNLSYLTERSLHPNKKVLIWIQLIR